MDIVTMAGQEGLNEGRAAGYNAAFGHPLPCEQHGWEGEAAIAYNNGYSHGFFLGEAQGRRDYSGLAD